MKSFEIASPLTDKDLKKVNTTRKATVRAVATGDRRPPKAGEWFMQFVPDYGRWLAFRAERDLIHNAPIAELVPKKSAKQ